MNGMAVGKCFWLNRAIEAVVRANLNKFCRYMLGGLIGAAGLLTAIYLKQLTGMMGLPITVLAIVVSAIVGGVGPGLFTAIVSAIGVDIFLLGPLSVSAIGWYGFLRLASFCVVSFLVSLIVSALRTSYARAEQARDEAEKMASEKDAVIEFLSHDLRGPLASISLSFQLIQRYVGVGNHEEDIRRLSGNGVFFCQRMTLLIQNLLDASMIKSGGIALRSRVQCMGDIVSAVCSEYHLLCEQKNIMLTVVRSGTLLVNCDQVLVSQVIANLLQNALKFTGQAGSIHVEVGEKNNSVFITVSDSGKGIGRAEIDHVFEKFWQAKKVSREGAGLGLFISRAIVEAHHGEISVASEIGVGTTFLILFPKADSISAVQSETDHQVSLVCVSEKTA